VVEALLVWANHGRGRRQSLKANALMITGRAALFLLGAAGTFYGLMAIYPPSMG
jgi:hypothetical protein